MLFLGSLIGLLFVGLAVDTTALTQAPGTDKEPEPLPETGEKDGVELEGTDGPDWLDGSEGDDLLTAFDGDDELHGGLGDDTLDAGLGDDWVFGDAGYGPGGDDFLGGAEGNDHLAGQGGNDTVHGGAGDDTIFGGEGDDLLLGGAGADWISGNAGNDTLYAGPGGGDLSGDDGDDVLYGYDGPGTNWLHGGTGNDTLHPGGDDYAEGGAGADLMVLQDAPHGVPVLGDFDAREDQIEIRYEARADGRPPEVLIERDSDGSALIRLDGLIVGRVLTPDGLKAGDILLAPWPAAR